MAVKKIEPPSRIADVEARSVSPARNNVERTLKKANCKERSQLSVEQFPMNSAQNLRIRCLKIAYFSDFGAAFQNPVKSARFVARPIGRIL